MKKIFMILLILFSSTSHAILCNVNVSDPRYNVVSYIRNQTSCVTTTQANPTLHKNVIGVTLLVMALNQFVENKKSEIADTSKEILLGEYAVVSCNMKNNKDSTYMQKINFLLNDKKAVSIFPDNTSIGNIYENINGKFERSNLLLTATLDIREMKVTGSGILNSYYSESCTVLESPDTAAKI